MGEGVYKMAYSAEILLDSISLNQDRLTTVQVTLPRIVLAELNTHRVFSRNSASSRAIPVEKQLSKILEDPFIPIKWGKNIPGMQEGEDLNDQDISLAKEHWLHQRDIAVLGAVALSGGLSRFKDEILKEKIAAIEQTQPVEIEVLSQPLHKSIVSRLLEPFMWHTVIITSTEWNNFFALRDHSNAQPELQKAAHLIKQLRDSSVPIALSDEEWHMPFIRPEEQEEFSIEVLRKMSVARCARVSYLTHDGVREPQKDVELHDQLRNNGHMSPFEHIATPITNIERYRSNTSGNFTGWKQYRKMLNFEDDYSKILELESEDAS